MFTQNATSPNMVTIIESEYIESEGECKEVLCIGISIRFSGERENEAYNTKIVLTKEVKKGKSSHAAIPCNTMAAQPANF